MALTFDVVILGAGPGGEVALNTLVKHGKRVALVEQEVIGGECTNWGCIPSKTLLRPTELRGQAMRTAGVHPPMLDFERLAEYRDYMVSNHDDSERISRYEAREVKVFKAPGRIAGRGRVEVDGEVLECEAIVVATGAEAVIPPIPGLAETGYWTNREATDLTEVPASAVVVGGGAVGLEISQFLARFGSHVTVIQGGDRLAPRDEPRIGERLAEILAEDGIELVLNRRAVEVRRDGRDRVVAMDDGSEARGEALVVATGRKPRAEDIGLDTVGIEPGRRGIEVDERCRAAEGVWAIGDVAGGGFTHVAKYQGRIAAQDILGFDVKADYRAVPRVYFTDPEVAAVGMTEAEAREAGIDVLANEIFLPTAIARPYTYQEHPNGIFGVVLDRERDILVGAWAVAPLASEWIHQAVLAIRAEIPCSILKDTIAQFPSYSEALGAALRALPTEEVGMMVDHQPHGRMSAPEAELQAAT
jgi:pyruvate/2-oxoglutarate dehydrogenase complex dihydrolipoamide dehydrogenase (E3) component